MVPIVTEARKDSGDSRGVRLAGAVLDTVLPLPMSGGGTLLARSLASIVRSAMAERAARAGQKPLVVGEVDLSQTDLTKPFVVDFSVPAPSSVQVKQQALYRLRRALGDLHAWRPTWLYQPKSDPRSGAFALYVMPTQLSPDALRHYAPPPARIAIAPSGKRGTYDERAGERSGVVRRGSGEREGAADDADASPASGANS